MTVINTIREKRYSPLIPAMKAICEAKSGDMLQIIMDDEAAFRDMKEFLSDEQIGFREIYDKCAMIVQFKK